MTEPFAPELVPWAAWSPEEVAQRLIDVEAPWCVAAGWAIDLFVDGVPREHEDIEIAVPADCSAEVFAALAPLEPFVVETGRAVPLAEAGELLTTSHQTWLLERDKPCWRLDVFREPSLGETWLCRRDENIRLPYAEVIARNRQGIPYLRPEVALLFKAKHARPKDDGDFSTALPLLEAKRRRWLAEALERVHPGHRWLAELA